MFGASRLHGCKEMKFMQQVWNTLSPLKWNKSASLKPIPRYLFGFLSTIPMDQEVPGNETMKHSGIIEHSWLENGPGWGVDGISQKKTWRYSSNRYVIGSLPEGRSFIWEIHSSISSLNIFWRVTSKFNSESPDNKWMVERRSFPKGGPAGRISMASC